LPGSEKGDRFTEIYNHYKIVIYYYCRKMVAESDAAKDIVQEVFVKFLENRDKLSQDNQIKIWLFKSARNRCLNYIRDRGRISSIGAGGDEIPGMIANDCGALDSAAIVATVFDNLSLDYREILVMREWSGLSYEEISEALDTTVSAVKSRLFKARKRAAEIYEKFYGEK
jgi:RNA polymerase sigma-70 factor (ECF subfamily)